MNHSATIHTAEGPFHLSPSTPTEPITTANRVYIDNGEVKTDIVTETMSIQEAKALTLKVIDLEYSLP